LRFPLRKDVLADLAEARRVAAGSEDLKARWAVAELAEQAEDSAAEEEWRTVLPLLEAQLKSRPADPALLEQHAQALIGADSPLLAVAAAEKLLALRRASFRPQVLHGDALLRRAELNWRVLVQVRQGSKDLPPAQLLQMNADLAACAKAYDRAVDLAPEHPEPRAARMALALARSVMASLLPPGALTGSERLDAARFRRDLMELVERNPGRVAPLWHAAVFFAAQPLPELEISAAERGVLEKGLADARANGDERVYLAEARGLLCAALKDWPGAARHFEEALATAPQRSFAAEWLVTAENSSREPRERRLARIRGRIARAPRSEDFTLLGILLADENRADAVAALRKAVELDVDNASARYNLAVLLLRMYRTTTEVRHHAQRVLELQPQEREAALLYCVVEALDGRDASARNGLRALLQRTDLDADLRRRTEETLADLKAAAR
jgi:hypothetical protein